MFIIIASIIITYWQGWIAINPFSFKRKRYCVILVPHSVKLIGFFFNSYSDMDTIKAMRKQVIHNCHYVNQGLCYALNPPSVILKDK